MTTDYPSHHDPNRGFRNPWPNSTPPQFPALFRWALDRMIHPPPRDPPASAFPTVSPTFVAPRAPADQLTVTWIGHSATLIQIGGCNLLTDPMLGRRASPFPFAGPRRWVPPAVSVDALPPLDVVLVSHNHYDHLHRGSVRALAARFPTTPWIAPLGLAPLLRRWGVRETEELDWWDAASLAGLTITATPAQHFSARGPTDRNRTLWCGFTISTQTRRAYFVGDTGYHPHFGTIAERLGPFDLTLMPVGAYDPRWVMRPVHLDPDEAVRAFLDLGGGASGVMGAIHWGTFKLTDEPMDEPPRRTRAAWQDAGLPAERLWIPRHGETRAI
jgi:N-acyl-phosphatidylethanolamine-hydrolysing phospholipase D